MRGAIFGLILLGVSSCGTASGPSGFCLHYLPIPTDDATPEFVQLVIDDNNAAFVSLCE